MYIALEGPDGGGKTTQAAILAGVLGAVLTREMGGTEAGRKLREIVLNPDAALCPVAEAFVTIADRAQHIEEIVAPALRAGRHVVSDRCYMSMIAYQCYGRGVPITWARDLCLNAINKVVPDLIIILMVDESAAADRLGEGRDLYETDAFAYVRRRARIAYRNMLKSPVSMAPSKVVGVDADGTRLEVASRIRDAVRTELGL